MQNIFHEDQISTNLISSTQVNKKLFCECIRSGSVQIVDAIGVVIGRGLTPVKI